MATLTVGAVGIDTSGLERTLRDLRKDQIPHARQLALNALAKDTIRVEKIEMQTSLDRPKPFVLGGLRMLKWAKKQAPSAVVGFTDITGRYGNRVENTIRVQIEGRDRVAKGVEGSLRSSGVLRSGEYIIPGHNAPLDRYGNVSWAEHKRMLAGLKRRGPGRKRYFVNRAGAGRAVYSVTGKRGKPRIMWIITSDNPTYRPRFDFYGEAHRHAAKFGWYFAQQAMKKALASAR